MRSKAEILDRSQKLLLKLPKEGQLMVGHEHLFLEVWIDIRDILDVLSKSIGSNLFDLAREA